MSQQDTLKDFGVRLPEGAPEDWFITEEPSGQWVALNDNSIVLKLDDVPGFMRKRNGIQWKLGKGQHSHVRFLFVDVEGLRVYVGKDEGGRTVITITKRDLYP